MVRYLVGNKVVTSSVGDHYHTENQVAGTSCQAVDRLWHRPRGPSSLFLAVHVLPKPSRPLQTRYVREGD